MGFNFGRVLVWNLVTQFDTQVSSTVLALLTAERMFTMNFQNIYSLEQ